MSGAAPMTNAMTVDVEDYFQVQAFTHCVEKSSWEHRPSRVEANVDRILRLFDDAGIKATFFTLGWIAVRHPEMVRRIVQAGHELASHGWDHTRADVQDADGQPNAAARGSQGVSLQNLVAKRRRPDLV